MNRERDEEETRTPAEWNRSQHSPKLETRNSPACKQHFPSSHDFQPRLELDIDSAHPLRAQEESSKKVESIIYVVHRCYRLCSYTKRFFVLLHFPSIAHIFAAVWRCCRVENSLVRRDKAITRESCGINWINIDSSLAGRALGDFIWLSKLSAKWIGFTLLGFESRKWLTSWMLNGSSDERKRIFPRER